MNNFCEGSDTAFPRASFDQGSNGLTKREEFAKAAMKGILAGDHLGGPLTLSRVEHAARLSVVMANALIKALNDE